MKKLHTKKSKKSTHSAAHTHEQQVSQMSTELSQLRREKQIEAALERVRTRTMSMQQSEDLAETSAVVFTQLANLGIPLVRSGFDIFDEENRKMISWISTATGGVINEYAVIPFNAHSLIKKMAESRKNEEYFEYKAYKRTLSSLTRVIAKYSNEMMREYSADESSIPNKAFLYEFWFAQGGLFVSSLERLEEDEIRVALRFAKVFEQTYTRFLDLKKAEAQAREAQIDVSVARVRARALAMHFSEEIQEVAALLRKEIFDLGLEGVSAATIWIEQPEGKIRVWDMTKVEESGSDNELNIDFEFEPESTPQACYFWDIWKPKGHYWIPELNKKDLYANESWLRTIDPKNADIFKEILDNGELEYTWHPTVPLEKGRLNLDFVAKPPEEVEFILQKMAAAFDLAYRRFEDLQLAETQAKEAQIEVALERVRAASMAMHHSESIGEVSSVLFEELKKLELSPLYAYISIIKEDEGIFEVWLRAYGGNPNPHRTTVPLKGIPTVEKNMVNWRSGIPYFKVSFEGKADVVAMRKSYYDQTGDEVFLEAPETDFQENLDARFNYGTVGLGCDYVISDLVIQIMLRFAKVFEQTYTRFLDLQKAEAQAREAHIEAALERVRARAMAMHSSDELAELIGNVFKEVSLLDVQLTRCWIWIFDPDTLDARMWWAHMEDLEAEEAAVGYLIPYNDTDFYQGTLKAWQDRKSKVVEVLGGDVKVKWDDFIFYKSEMSKVPDEIRDGMRAPDSVYLCSSFNNFGGLGTAGLEPLSDENQDIIYRFARVFDLTYTRFNDLVQAGEQAREAQIEAALERVRSRTMGMQRSDELAETASILFE